MMDREQWSLTEKGLQRRTAYLCLLAAGVLECLYAATHFICINGFFMLNEYFAENYLIIPCLVFLGAALSNPLTKTGKRSILLGCAMVGWFLIVELWNGVSDRGLNTFGPFFIVYLMAYPFAAVTREREQSKGLFLLGFLYIAAGLLMVGYTGLLYMGRLPWFMRAYVFWDGARLNNIWHPNVTGGFLLLCMGFSVAFFLRTRARWLKVCFLLAVAAEFVCLTLTNSRTSILLGCAMLGGIVFFAWIAGSGWKRWLTGLLAAAVTLTGSYLISKTIYTIHSDYRVEQVYAQMQKELASGTAPDQAAAQSGSQGTLKIDEATGEMSLQSVSTQGSLAQDMRTLNGRTVIWKAALQALMDNPEMLLLGTKNVSEVLVEYGSFPADHTHNSFVQVLMNLGLLGLLFALIYAVSVLRSGLMLLFGQGVELWKKVIVITVFCIFMAGMLETYLYIPVFGHFLAFPYHLLGGYVVHWKDQLQTA